MIVFVALLSKSFVGRVIDRHHWYGIALIVVGLGIVGVSDLTPDSKKADTNGIITGIIDLLFELSYF